MHLSPINRIVIKVLLPQQMNQIVELLQQKLYMESVPPPPPPSHTNTL